MTHREGQLARLLDNPYHNERLAAWGLDANNIFGCVQTYAGLLPGFCQQDNVCAYLRK